MMNISTFYAHFDGMTWPRPGEGLAELEWRLRYAQDAVTETDKLVCASIVAAYTELVKATQKRRNGICQQLKDEAITALEELST